MASQKTVLVTGASGFIGSHLCAALASRGDCVRALYRRAVPPPELEALAASGAEGAATGDAAAKPQSPKSASGAKTSRAVRPVELFNADLVDAARVREAVSGVDAIVHVAALASDWGPYELFKRHNYDATVDLLQAAETAGAKVFVYISSAVVSGFGVHVDSTEEGPYYPLEYPYQTTKRLAERFVLGRNRPGFRTVAIRPCNVYGPGDRTSTYKMYEAISGGIFGYIGTGEAYTCPVYIDDLCSGIMAALDRDESGGEAIILTDGEKVRWKDYAETMFRAIGSKKRPTHLPVPVVAAAARTMTFFARLARRPSAPPLTMYRVEQASQHYHFSNAKARRILDFEPKVFYEEGLAITAAAFLRDMRPGG
jgi:nucleoside-diphosphate-sugar epimerase